MLALCNYRSLVLFANAKTYLNLHCMNAPSRLLGVYEEDERAGGSRGRKSTGGSGAGNSNLSAGIRGMFGNVRELIFDQWGKKMHYIDIDKVCHP